MYNQLLKPFLGFRLGSRQDCDDVTFSLCDYRGQIIHGNDIIPISHSHLLSHQTWFAMAVVKHCGCSYLASYKYSIFFMLQFYVRWQQVLRCIAATYDDNARTEISGNDLRNSTVFKRFYHLCIDNMTSIFQFQILQSSSISVFGNTPS